MKKIIFFFAIVCCSGVMYGQKPNTPKEPPVPCDGSADGLPGRYTDHTNPKYPTSLKASSAAEKTAMLNQLIALEKLEEKSRSQFKLTGCVARVSFSTLTGGSFAGCTPRAYSYQLGVYANVCHIAEHIVKTVDEYRTVLRVNVNPMLSAGNAPAGGTGEFYLTDKTVRYEIPLEPSSRVAQYLSESMVLANRSNDYKNSHAEFLKIINGDGYTENWMSGSREDKPSPHSYWWIERCYLITRPGVPLLIPVTRKQFLEDLLEYFETEKSNFYISLESKLKNIAGNNSDNSRKMRATMEADRAAYPLHYAAKKAKVNQLLSAQSNDWLQTPAVVEYNSRSYDANQRLADIGKFFDAENEYRAALYVYNPEYFKRYINQTTRPLFMEVAFRYEIAADRGFSGRLFQNFAANYDMDALRKMVE